MYGTGQNSAKGLQPTNSRNSSTCNYKTTPYNIASGYATSIFTNDPVTILSNGTIGIGVAGSPCIGVFAGCQYIDATGAAQFLPYWPANTATMGGVNATALILDDPALEYDIQVSTSSGTPGPVNAVSLAQSDMGKNANFAITANSFNPIQGVTPLPNPGAGNTATGQSAYYLDYSTIGTTATLNLKLLRFTEVPGNVAGVYFNNAVVQFNNHIRNSGTGTTGI